MQRFESTGELESIYSFSFFCYTVVIKCTLTHHLNVPKAQLFLHHITFNVNLMPPGDITATVFLILCLCSSLSPHKGFVQSMVSA